MRRQELEEKLVSLDLEIEAYKEYIKTERARELIGIVKRTGWYKGEVLDLTKKQYRAVTGKEPKKAIISPKTGKIPWEYALDVVADEMGYRSDEHLRKAIEEVVKSQSKLQAAERERDLLKKEIAKLKPRVRIYHRSLQFNGTTKAKEIMVNGEMRGILVRYPSHWAIYKTKEVKHGKELPPAITAVRYAKEAEKRAKKELDRAIKPKK